MHSIASSADLRRLFATSVLARLPLAMLSIGLLVHAQYLTGSFAAAGVVTGVYAIALGVGGPLLGRLVDRRGQTVVLLTSAAVAAALLVAIALQPVGASLAVLLALAAGIGLVEPPVGACLRTQLPALIADPGAVRAVYALEASVVELTFIFGPPLALCIGALWSTGAALAVGGIVLLIATAAFAAQPASRSWRPAPADRRPRGGSLRTPAMRTLVIILVAVGVLLGAAEVAIVAAAKSLDSTTAAAPLLALWGVGSFAGGLLAARLGGGARTGAGLAFVLGALTAGILALVPAAGSVVALGGVLLLGGATIARRFRARRRRRRTCGAHNHAPVAHPRASRRARNHPHRKRSAACPPSSRLTVTLGASAEITTSERGGSGGRSRRGPATCWLAHRD